MNLKGTAWWIPVPGILVLGVDRILKSWVTSHLFPNERLPVLGASWLQLNNYTSPVLSDGTTSIVLWCLVCLLVLARAKRSGRLERAGYGILLMAGASNLWDHWRLGRIVAPLCLGLSGGRLLPFSVADVAVSTAAPLVACLITLRVIYQRPRASGKPTKLAFNHRNRFPREPLTSSDLERFPEDRRQAP